LKCYNILLVWALLSLLPVYACAAETATAKELNDDGVLALDKGNWPVAFDKFTAALLLDPDDVTARENLVIAHSNYGLYLKDKDKLKALKEFHYAQYLDQDQKSTVTANLRGMIKVIGKDPDNFIDRIRLGDQAKLQGFPIGAVVEYRAALKLKDDPQVHKKLGNVYRLLNQNEKAAAEDEAAARIGRAVASPH
jgi:tetratricopeptide (TPR) repeat protein